VVLGLKANERITVHNMVLAVKLLGKLSWMVIRSLAASADKSN